MARLSIFLILLGALAEGSPPLVKVSLSKVFVPVGFDSNDLTQIVGVGVFPHTCYQVGPMDIDVDEQAKIIRVKQHAYLYPGHCLPVTVPFQQVIDVGIIDVGNYEIIDDVSGNRLGSLPIRLAKDIGPGTDDFPYAPVDDAYVKTNPGGPRTLLIQGTFTNSCMKMKRLDVTYYQDVVVVLPISEMEKPENGGCTAGLFGFTQKVPLVFPSKHAYLLHIRSMAGNAINIIHQP